MPALTLVTAPQVYFNEASGGRYVPRAILMDLVRSPAGSATGVARLSHAHVSPSTVSAAPLARLNSNML